MATEVSAYDYRLWEIRFHEVDLNVPEYDDESPAGRVRVETTLNFAIDDDRLFCAVNVEMDLIKGKDENASEDALAASLKLTGTGKFELPEGHELSDEDLKNLDDESVRSFSKILEPLVLSKARKILADASIDASGVPLQLAPPR